MFYSVVTVPEFMLSVGFIVFLDKTAVTVSVFWRMGRSAVNRRAGYGRLRWQQGWSPDDLAESTE